MSKNTELAVPEQRSILHTLADRFGMEPLAFQKTVIATCGLKGSTPEEFAAFLLVANQYGLNPITREIYAFPKQGGGIVPIVSIDGWLNLINSHPACDGFEFEMEHDEEGKLVSCTCKIFRKDRGHPIAVTEYLEECYRPTAPWKMAHRMLRHKALIQAARYAFGFAGIYDPDEGEKIAEARDITPPPAPPPAPPAPEHLLPPIPQEVISELYEGPGEQILPRQVVHVPRAGRARKPASTIEHAAMVARAEDDGPPPPEVDEELDAFDPEAWLENMKMRLEEAISAEEIAEISEEADRFKQRYPFIPGIILEEIEVAFQEAEERLAAAE